MPTCEVVNVMSLSGVVASFALFRRYIVPPVMKLTGTPVSLVNSWPMYLSIRSRKLPPQLLITRASSALATPANIALSTSPAVMIFRIIEYPFQLIGALPNQSATKAWQKTCRTDIAIHPVRMAPAAQAAETQVNSGRVRPAHQFAFSAGVARNFRPGLR